LHQTHDAYAMCRVHFICHFYSIIKEKIEQKKSPRKSAHMGHIFNTDNRKFHALLNTDIGSWGRTCKELLNSI